MNVVLLGAGQLGSRHLQALKKVSFPLNITVFDPSEASLAVAKERYEQVTTDVKHQIAFTQDLKTLPKDIFFAVIATNSNVRYEIFKSLLDGRSVKNALLEKILFNQEQEYTAGLELMRSSGTRTWVNCCMRMQNLYKDMRPEFQGKAFTYNVTGSNYGLVTNAIHYIDHACSLAGSTKFSVDTSGLVKKLPESKRKGFFELFGTLKFTFDNGATVSLTCREDGNAPVLIEIMSDDHRYIVRENENKYWRSTSESGWKWEEKELGFLYQSGLTNLVAEALAKGDSPALPDMKESSEIHLNLLRPLKEYCRKNFPQYQGDFQFT